MKDKLTESYKLPTEVMAYARAYKKATGISMSAFIEEAVNKQIVKLPKRVKAKMLEIDPTLCL